MCLICKQRHCFISDKHVLGNDTFNVGRCCYSSLHNNVAFSRAKIINIKQCNVIPSALMRACVSLNSQSLVYSVIQELSDNAPVQRQTAVTAYFSSRNEMNGVFLQCSSRSRRLPTILKLGRNILFFWNVKDRVGLEPAITDFPSRQHQPLHQGPRPTFQVSSYCCLS